MRKLIVWGIAVLSIAILVIGCGEKAQEIPKPQPEAQEETQEKPQAPTSTTTANTPQRNEGHIGEPVMCGGLQIIVHSATPYTDPSGAWKPKPGNYFLALDVSVENKGSASEFVSVGHEYKVKDSEGFSYGSAVTTIQPLFEGGNLLPGDKSRGYVVYEIKQGSTGLYLLCHEPLDNSSAKIWLE